MKPIFLRYATGNDGCLFWASAYGDDVAYLLAFREVVALLVRCVLPHPNLAIMATLEAVFDSRSGRYEDIVIDGTLALDCFAGAGLNESVLDAVESGGRYIVAVTPMPSAHSFPSPANLTFTFTTRASKFSSVPHRVTDLRGEGNPYDPGYLPGSHTRVFASGTFEFDMEVLAPTLLLVQPVASDGASN
jgi:hypothetical protein